MHAEREKRLVSIIFQFLILLYYEIWIFDIHNFIRFVLEFYLQLVKFNIFLEVAVKLRIKRFLTQIKFYARL